MKLVKKSFNTSGDMAQKIDDFVKENPGISFTWLMNQAIKRFLDNPVVELKPSKRVTVDDVNHFIDENQDLMNDLAK